MCGRGHFGVHVHRFCFRPRLRPQESVNKRLLPCPRPHISVNRVSSHIADTSAELNITKHVAGETKGKEKADCSDWHNQCAT